MKIKVESAYRHSQHAKSGYKILSTMTAQEDMACYIKYGTINCKRYIEFLEKVISNRERLLVLLVDHATFHGSKNVRTFVRAHHGSLIILFLPKHAPEINPDE